MKKITLAFILICACGVLAYAGPVSAEKNVTPMAPAPACDWTGFYVGVNVGVTEYRAGFTDEDYWWNGATTTYEKPAFIGGGQIGYNYQWRDLVLGIEADFSGLGDADHDNKLTYCSFCDAAEYGETVNGEGYYWQQRAKVDFMATLRGKIGISFLDNKAMIYVTGGGAYAHGRWDVYFADYSVEDSRYDDVDWRGDDWRWGWVGGFGIEYALNCHWSIRAEGLYTWLNSDTQGVDRGRSGEGAHEEAYAGHGQRFEDDLWSYRIGINYKFTGFGGGH